MNSATKLTTPLSLALAAPLVEKMGIIFLFKFAGFLTVVLVLIQLATPKIRNFEKFPAPEIQIS
jgi:hypothetical protein